MSKAHYYIAIMAGGLGSRFWPSSRENFPKQFLDINGSGRSLIQQTVDRARLIVPIKNILIVSNENYKNLILEQLPELNENQLLLEPSRNNTAPCVAYTALHLKARDTKAVFAMLPSDHIIANEELFCDRMLQGFEFASREDAIVTLGITPHRPDTGYGYINFDREHVERNLHKVHSFREKPDKATAQAYITSGEYLWNAGIFIWSVKTILDSFQKNAPEIIAVLNKHPEVYNTSSEKDYIAEYYPKTQSISVDFAILEKAQNVYTLPSDIGWSDLGTWNSLYDFLPKDVSANVIQSTTARVIDSSGCFVRTSQKDKMIVMKGLENFIVIDDGNVLMIYPREQEQEIKALRQAINEDQYL